MDVNIEKITRQIIKICTEMADIAKIILYIPKAKGTHMERSDIDIAIKGNDICTIELLDSLDIIDTLSKIDLVDIQNCKNELLKRGVEKMYTAIIPASGTGSRMGLGHNKLFHKIAKRTIVEHTVAVFLNDIKCSQIIITTTEEDLPNMQAIFKNQQRIEFVIGGKTRQISVFNALSQVNQKIVLIHDAARPFVTQQIIDDCYDTAERGFGVIAAVSPKDTIKQRNTWNTDIVSRTIPRDELVCVQTPQAFPTDVLRKAHQLASNAFATATDDATIVENHTEIQIKIVEGCYKNIKFTTPEDISYFEFLMKKGR